MFSKEGCCLKSIFSQRRKDLSPVRTNTHVTPLEHLHQLARQCSVHFCSPRNPSNSREALCHCSQELDYFRFGKMVLSQNSAKKTLAVWTSLWISLPCKSSAEEKSIFAVSSQQLLSTMCFQPSLREAVAKCSDILDTSIQREVQLHWHVFINIVCADYLQVLTFSSYPCLIFPSINSSRSCSLLFSKRHFILSHVSSGTVVLQFLLAPLHKHKGTVTVNGTPIT